MSHAEFLEWLWKIAGGWLNWRPNEFEFANMADITTAYEGQLEKLEILHGSNKKDKKKPISTAEEFIAAFGNKGKK